MREVRDFEDFMLICQDLHSTVPSCGIQRDGDVPLQFQFDNWIRWRRASKYTSFSCNFLFSFLAFRNQYKNPEYWHCLYTGNHIYRTTGWRWKSNGRHTCWLFEDNELASSFGSPQSYLPPWLAASEKPGGRSPH